MFFFPVTFSGVPVTSVQNPGKMGRNARDNFDCKKCPWQFFNARDKICRDKKKSPWQKSKIMPVTFWGPIFFPRLRRGPFFYWDFVTIIFLAVTIFENAVTFLQKSSVACETCPWLFLKKIARDISHMPVTLVKKSACDMPKCPWQFSKSGNVTGKKISREKNHRA